MRCTSPVSSAGILVTFVTLANGCGGSTSTGSTSAQGNASPTTTGAGGGGAGRTGDGGSAATGTGGSTAVTEAGSGGNTSIAGGSGDIGAGGSSVVFCVTGVTQACLGPGACKGAQVCLPDASGWGPCDCGPGTGGNGGSGGQGTGGDPGASGGDAAGGSGGGSGGDSTCPKIQLEVVMSSFTVKAGKITGTPLNCPPGKVVVCGGFSHAADGTVMTRSEIISSQQWNVEAYSPTANTTVAGYLYCAPSPPGYATVLGVQSAPAVNNVHVAVANCPDGAVPMGGGFGHSDQSITLRQSSPGPTSWNVSGFQAIGSGDALVPFAVCAKASPCTTTVTGATINGGTGIAACPSGQVAIGGGFSSEATFEAVIESFAVAEGWRVTSLPGPDVTPYAICSP